MGNNFFNDSNKAYSENLNDGILVGNAFDWTISIGLPSDTDGVFPSSSDVVMAKVADVSATPNSNLSIGSTIENNSSSSQVYRLTVYPNFNRFGGFKSISLTADSGVTFYIANKGGNSPIASNLDYDDLGNVPELKVLKEYDIVLTIPKNKEVTGLEFVFQSSSADVSGVISQGCVDGLVDDVARIGVLETSTSGVVNVDLKVSKYIITYGETVTITATVTDFNGNPIKNKQLLMKQNGNTVDSLTTNNNGVATLSSPIHFGHYTVGGVSLPVTVMSFTFKGIDTPHYDLYVNEVLRIARVHILFDDEDITPGLTNQEVSAFIPADYLPAHNIIRPITRDGKIYCYIWGSNGTIGISNTTSSNYSLTCDVQIEYHY